MPRVVADTNIFISALIFGGVPGVFLDLALGRFFELVTSPILLDELDEKLRGKFELSPGDAALIRLRLETSAIIVIPNLPLKVIAEDPDDDRVLECAVAAAADYIVSGDRHLLKFGSFRNISILTVREFLNRTQHGS